MKCPKCQKKMFLKNKSFSYNTDTKPQKKYLRKIYWCKTDDVWVSIEVPLTSKK